MNKCQITEDLLPLYIDEVCTDGSREFVDTHVSECPQCAALLKQMQTDTHAEKEAKLQKEKDVALRLNKKKRDAGIIKTLTIAVAAAYLPIMLLLSAVVEDKGLISVNYPFKLLTLILYTLPMLLFVVHWGFTASLSIEGQLVTKKEKALDNVANTFSILSAAVCFVGSELPYFWLYLSLLFALAAVITRLAEKKVLGLSFGIAETVKQKSFAALTCIILAVAIAVTLTVTRLSESKNKPDPEAPTVGISTEEIII